jgi:site-specific DNA-methyltransferase (adenine-specific)
VAECGGMNHDKPRAPRNRTLTLTPAEREFYTARLKRLDGPVTLAEIENRTVNGDTLEIIDYLPIACVDLLILDPPYNLTKTFGGRTFKTLPPDAYADWLESWLPGLCRTLKPTASVYICADWASSGAVHRVAARYLKVRSRITWEREKGRAQNANWKNTAEDIWFCTAGNTYTFNSASVRLKRRVRAPYREGGAPKGWQPDADGDFRLTAPSNFWSDITVPFWSMPENTDHPTQKPEKLIAKLVLASSQPGDLVLDPFLGSGTTSVVARKLGRRYAGVEISAEYCCLAEKRLELAVTDRRIQGYDGEVFWERNSQPPGRA